MAIDTTIGNGAPGIASMATESFANAAEPRYGEGVPTTTPHLVTAGADLDLAIYSVISISAAGVIALAKANAAAGFAALALTFSGTGTAADTVTIDGKVYTLRAALSTGPTVANEILIGGTAADTAANLNAAINGAAGEGTTYSEGTVAQTRVSSSISGAVVTVTANDPGDEGNAIAVAEAGTGTAWAGAGTVLAGGDDDMELKAYGILAAPLVLLNGASTTVPIYREGYWDMGGLVWDATFIDDDMKKHAFEGSVSPNIFIGKKKFSNADIPV